MPRQPLFDLGIAHRGRQIELLLAETVGTALETNVNHRFASEKQNAHRCIVCSGGWMNRGGRRSFYGVGPPPSARTQSRLPPCVDRSEEHTSELQSRQY